MPLEILVEFYKNVPLAIGVNGQARDGRLEQVAVPLGSVGSGEPSDGKLPLRKGSQNMILES